MKLRVADGLTHTQLAALKRSSRISWKEWLNAEAHGFDITDSNGKGVTRARQ